MTNERASEIALDILTFCAADGQAYMTTGDIEAIGPGAERAQIIIDLLLPEEVHGVACALASIAAALLELHDDPADLLRDLRQAMVTP